MVDIMEGIPIMAMVDIMEDTGEVVTPITEVPTGPDTTMVSTTDIITVVVIITGPHTGMAEWITATPTDIQAGPM